MVKNRFFPPEEQMEMELALRPLEENGLSHRVFFVRDEREALACLLFQARDGESGEEAEKAALAQPRP